MKAIALCFLLGTSQLVIYAAQAPPAAAPEGSAAQAETRVPSAREEMIDIIGKARKADYEGDQKGMARAYSSLEKFLGVADLASRARYWRGFAQWRRAINGFNDNVPEPELELDLTLAMEEFEKALAADPAFFDARIGLVSAQGYWMFLHRKDKDKVREFYEKNMSKYREAAALGADHPRMLWALGPTYFGGMPDHAGEQRAIDTYLKGLDLIRRPHAAPADPIEPSWGEPELLMMLAWSFNNKQTPDPEVAWKYAQEALALAPNWHYLRDILMPQIQARREK